MIQLVDIKGFFDAESLCGVMGSLYTAQIPKKAYKMWIKLNSKTVIQVATPSGLLLKREKQENCAARDQEEPL